MTYISKQASAGHIARHLRTFCSPQLSLDLLVGIASCAAQLNARYSLGTKWGTVMNWFVI
jgi:hypothetical protein